MRQFLVLVFATSNLLVAVAPHVWAQSTVSAVKQYRPFTATIRTTYFDEEGRETILHESFSRRTDGSYAHSAETEAYGERGTTQFILNTADRSWTHADSFTGSIMVIPLPEEREFSHYLEFPASCTSLTDGSWKKVGESERFGITVFEVEDTITKNLTSKLWVAPVLECFRLLDLFFEKGEVRMRKEVLSLEFGDPDPVAFRVPSGYVDVSPLQFEKLSKRRFNGRGYYGDERALQLEREYQNAKVRSRRPGAVR